MRATIEIRDDTRAKLIELAARRGETDFSVIVQEALDEYLRAQEDQRAAIEEAVSTLGSLDEDEAELLHRHAYEVRHSWR